MSTADQRAYLRIITTLPDGVSYGLVWQATLVGLDLYAGKLDREGRELFRVAYHRDGKTHFYTPSGQVRTQQRVPLAEVEHIEKIFAWNPTPIRPGYKRQSDSATRRTLHFEWIGRRPAFIDLWVAGPKAGGHPLETVLRERPYIYAREHDIAAHAPGIEIIGTLVSDWTTPRLVVVLSAFSKDTWGRRPSALDVPIPRPFYVGAMEDQVFAYDPSDGAVGAKLMETMPSGPWDRVEPKPRKKQK